MKNRNISALLFLLLPLFATAQLQLGRQAIATAGGHGVNAGANLSISYTVGEVAVQTRETPGADIILTEGFQQPDEDIDTGTKDLFSLCELGLTVFPNPVSQALNIRLEAPLSHPVTASLFSPSGQAIRTVEIATGDMQLDMSRLPGGLYLLRFAQGGKVYPACRVLKVDNR
ncbi:MAG: T9SS type A sorting domain-containing protein [Phaeodactylibacter sp.]|nr:T9SS type A sorting domain-containing protein [Phaeodactylibacter sp.]MCB9293796.1 T9SS type A sorting domain-containing protein [Lewinellaceae bacterium]